MSADIVEKVAAIKAGGYNPVAQRALEQIADDLLARLAELERERDHYLSNWQEARQYVIIETGHAEDAEARAEAAESALAELKVCGRTAIDAGEVIIGRLQAELAKAREALDRYREAVNIDVKMEGPRFMGANLSALKRAWEADLAALAPEGKP